VRSNFFADGKIRWGINIDDMWNYAGLPPPTNIDRKQIFTKRIEGEIRGISNRNITIGKPATPRDYDGDFPELRKTARDAISDLASELIKSNLDYVRCWFQWNFFQPKIDSETYRFPLDDFVTKLRSKDVEIVAVIGNGYSRFLPLGVDENDPKSYLESLEKASRAIVKHYVDSIQIWQLENEPNWWFAHVSSGWRRGRIWETPGFRDTVLQALYNIIQEESPSSTKTINLEADRKKTDWKAYAKFCDVIGLDFYPNYAKPLPINVSGFDLATDVKNQTGLPLFIAETGYPSGPKIAGYSESNQAQYVTTASQKVMSQDCLNGISLWRYSDSNWKSSPAQENHFGLKKQDGSAKPAWRAYTEIIRAAKSGESLDQMISHREAPAT
jgi:hypothetical protein